MKLLSFLKAKPRRSLLLGFAVLLTGAAIFAGINTGTQARDCDSNAIMYCGAYSDREFKDKLNKNQPGDLVAIYRHYKIDTKVNLNNASNGIVTPKGEVIVNGKVVAKNAWTVGRQWKPNSKQVNINGRTYYQRANTGNLTRNYEVFVIFDTNGRYLNAIIKDCGNPVIAEPTQEPPEVVCTQLTAVRRNYNTFEFTAHHKSTNGGQIKGAFFDFGDGKKENWNGNIRTHTFAKPGNYTVRAVLKTNVGDRGGNKCVIKVNVPKPDVACTGLKAVQKSRNTYEFTVSDTRKNGGKINGWHFNYGDGKSETWNGHIRTHTYSKPGTYTVRATLKTNAGDKTSDKCVTKVTIKMPDIKGADCVSLFAQVTNRTRVTLNGRATTLGSVRVTGYVYTITDSNGRTVFNREVSSSQYNNSVTANITKAGNYRAKLVVKTTEGNRTAKRCEAPFTIKEAPETPKPGVSIEKKVDGVERKQVKVGQEFVYQLVVKNTGNTTLKNVKVTDNAPANVQFIRASTGAIKSNKWSHTIPILEKGKSASFSIRAKVVRHVESTIKNTACVDAPAVSGGPDDCDDAYVYVPPKPPAPPKPPVVKKIEVCELKTKKIITIDEKKFNSKLHSKDLNDCKKTPTPPTPEVKKIQVCELETGKIVTIDENTFDEKKYSRDLNDCKEAPVPPTPVAPIEICDQNSGTIITINEDDYDAKKHTVNLEDCGKTPAPEIPEELPQTGIGSGIAAIGLGSLTISAGYYIVSRRKLHSL